MPSKEGGQVAIGERIARLRHGRGLTQEDLARTAQVSVDVIRRLEQGQRDSARLSTLERIASGLGTQASTLLAVDEAAHAGHSPAALESRRQDHTTFGAKLRELRQQRGMSLRQLGRQVHCSHGYLWDLEHGGKRPSLAVAALLDGALDAGRQLSGLALSVSADSMGESVPSAEMIETGPADLEFVPDWRRGVDLAVDLWRRDRQRRTPLHGIAFVASGFLSPAMRWLTAPFDEQPAGVGERAVGTVHVDSVRRITGVFRELDNQYGGGQVRDSIIRFLTGEVAELLHGRYDVRTGLDLLSAAAETTQLAGWTSYDAGFNGLAQRYMIHALRLAAAAGDRALGAEILAAMSHQAAYLSAGAEAVDLARAASRAAVDAGVAAINAEASVLEAHGHAVAGDAAACASALNRAERILDKADRQGEPQWIGYFDEAYLAAKFGHCFIALGRGDLARRFALRSLQVDGRRFARGRQFNLVLLARAHVQSDEPEEAGVVGLQAVDAMGEMRSQRAVDYLADLSDRLAPYAGLSAVDAFADRCGRCWPVARTLRSPWRAEQ